MRKGLKPIRVDLIAALGIGAMTYLAARVMPTWIGIAIPFAFVFPLSAVLYGKGWRALAEITFVTVLGILSVAFLYPD